MAVTTLTSALYAGTVTHHRHHGPSHRFVYPLSMWLLDLEELEAVQRAVRGFGHNRRRPVAFFDRDHLDGTDRPLGEQLADVVGRHGVRMPAGPVRVLTQCRVLGYVFNPVSFWYCHDEGGELAAIVCEVNNTFGQRHCYVSGPADWRAAHDEGGDAGRKRWSGKKVFHVSPFFSLDGTYAFAMDTPAARALIRIDLSVNEQRRIVTTLSLAREPLSSTTVARVMARYPLITVRIIAAIHWQALRLWRKGATYHPKPPYDPEVARRGAS